MANEKRLIDQDKFKALLNQQIEFGAPDLIAAVYAALHDSQVVDAVVVVRCHDCFARSCWEKDDNGCDICWVSGMYVKGEDDFCSYGERMG